jgi:hypothetical protein
MGIGTNCNRVSGTNPTPLDLAKQELERKIGLSSVNNVDSEVSICLEDFTRASYTMSGACVNILGVQPLGCPDGYSLSLSGDTCLKTTTTGATLNGTLYTGYTGSVDAGYNSNGTRFYSSNLTGGLPYQVTGTTTALYDTSGNTISEDQNNTTDALWDSLGSTSNGRLNNVGIWATSGATTLNPPYLEWIGFSECVNIPTTGTYSIGFAADNRSNIYIDGELFFTSDFVGVTTQDLSVWKVFDYDFYAGEHVIEMEGYNLLSSEASIGLEIYSGSVNTLTGITTTSGLSQVTIFTTADLRTDVTGEVSLFELGDSNGYSCPAGYYLDTCSYTGGTGYTCTLLETTGTTGTLIETTDCTHNLSDVTTVPIVFDFTGSTQYTGYTGEFCYKIFSPNSVLINKKCIPYTDITDGSVTDTLDFTGLASDVQKEYRVRTWDVFQSKCTSKIVDTSLYKPVDTTKDAYFVTVTNPPKPVLIGQGNDLFEDVVFHNTVQTIETESNVFTLTSTPAGGSTLVMVNGITLAPTEDYTIAGNLLTFTNETLNVNDKLQIAWFSSQSNALTTTDVKSDMYYVDQIVTGVTASTTNVLNLRPDQNNRLEFFLEKPVLNQPVIAVNGVNLAADVDFFVSGEVPNKINFSENVPIQVGDVITALYLPSAGAFSPGFLGKLIDDTVTIGWKVIGNVGRPNELNGSYFKIDITSFDDLTYQNIILSDIVKYRPGTSSYEIEMGPITDDSIDNYIYRVTFYKSYNTRYIQKTYTTSTTSDNGSFIINWDYINSTNW